MTSHLELTNLDTINLDNILLILQPYLKDISMDAIKFELDCVLIPHPQPELLLELDWKTLAANIEASIVRPTPRCNIHKPIPPYIATEWYQQKYVPTANLVRRLTKDNKPLPTLEITFSTAQAQLQDLHTSATLGSTAIKKQISTSSGYIQCPTCLLLRPKKSHTSCLPTCSYCAQKGHQRSQCNHLKNYDLRFRLCATCGEDHEASSCPKLQTTRQQIMTTRQQKALKLLQQEALKEQQQAEEKALTDTPSTQPKKRQRREELTQEDMESTCQYCYNIFEPEILAKHLNRCPLKPQSLQQTKLPFK
jgi:hypothetical protein